VVPKIGALCYNPSRIGAARGTCFLGVRMTPEINAVSKGRAAMRYAAVVMVALLATTPARLFGQLEDSPDKIRVLIVDGFSNHDWRRNTALLREILEATKLIDVSVSTAPNKSEDNGWEQWRPVFADYDVVIQTCNDLPGGSNGKTPGLAWPKEVQDAFEKFVAAGGGVLIYHAGNNAFANWPAYNEIIGLGWRKADFGRAISLSEQGDIHIHEPGDGGGTGHGPRLDTLVMRRGDHPIHAGLPRSWTCAELEVYYYARGPAKNLEVLSYALDPRTKLYWPIEWTVRYGQGRVYNSTYGHVWQDQSDPPNLKDPVFLTILPRALQWLAGCEVTFPIRDDFPR